MRIVSWTSLLNQFSDQSSDLHTFADEIIFSLRVNNFIATLV